MFKYKLTPKVVMYVTISMVLILFAGVVGSSFESITATFENSKVINPPVKHDYIFPAWLKGIAGFWAQGMVSDDQYFTTIQWLNDHNYIRLKTGSSFEIELVEVIALHDELTAHGDYSLALEESVTLADQVTVSVP